MGRKGSSPGPTGAIIGGMEMSDRGSPLPMGEMTVQKPRIKTERHCRDIPFLILFGLFWLGMVANSGFGWNQGNPRRLLYGLDYKGQLCEGDFDVKYWMNPNQVYDSGVVDNPFNIKDARAICLKSCPSTSANGTLGWVCDYPEGPITLTKTEWADRTYDYFDTLSAELKNTSLNLLGPCYPVLFNSSNFFWSCQLTASPSNESLAQWTSLGGVSVNQGEFIVKAIQDLLSAPGEIFKRYIADLENAWPVLVVCGGIAPLLLSIVWLVVIRLFAGVVTWITIIVLNFATIAVTVYLYIKAGWIGTDAISAVIGSDAVDTLALETSHSMQNHLKIVAVVMTIISVIIVLITVVLIKRVFMAVAVLKVASKAIGAIPSLMIYPVFPALVLLFFFVYWMVTLLYLFSAGEITQNVCNNGCCAYDLLAGNVTCGGCCGYEFHHTKNIVWSIFYHIFGGFWTAAFINACSLTIIAGAVVSYYWVRGERALLPTFPVLSSTKRLLRYSLGSVAIGSFLVAVIQMIRFILEFIRNKLKAVEAAPGGCLISILCCCAQCCLGCIEWTLKFINRNAYIVIAIKGKGFFRAAAKASGLIINNILRVGTVNVLGDFVLFLGKACVSVAGAFFAFLMLDQHRYKSGSNKVSSPLFPVLFCWIFGYSIASMFFGVVEMAIDTILLSFCIDCEENNGNARFAPPLLMDTLGRHARYEEERKSARRG
ncbi:hypothetical protein MPTK1_1g18950 [Marchantia polymorpha subsp. ruderalis]|uniref:Choline transporter-like protein n=2 Tax=Marchantia polymorpha TaxID=3197 RepID=A0AAF6ARQ7_MARPO|nr:hypothetical protein MARPO_0001s0233 [Marchantia polymorpha]BBM99127.1 hypothetical protein Mp_1g18950 [Marchantia polymorpha subsp. ruderalis]|eukprot:PTQ50204.1 hypothetical protein MARPO_0001s0233 [Marchantia polymorpha]